MFQSMSSAGVCFCRNSRHNCVMVGIVKNTKNADDFTHPDCAMLVDPLCFAKRVRREM
jgi:hypothetical protein